MNALPMNCMQRTLTALGQREPDRVPLFLLTGLQGARELGVSIKEYYSRADWVAEGQMRLHAKFRGDCLLGFFYASIETEAFGGETIFVPDGPANCGDPVITRFEDIDTLQLPQIQAAPGLNRVLETIRLLKARVGDTVPIVGVAISPFSLPVMQMGFDRYIELIFEQPERFQRLMAINQAFTRKWANAQLKAGATAICYFDPVSSPTIIPRETYLHTGHPVAKSTLAEISGPTATHLASGRALPILEDIIATGTAAVGISALEDLAELKAAAAGRISLLGNLNGVEMRRWTPDQTEAAVKRAIAKAGVGGGFLLSDNHGEIPWQVPDEVLFAIGDAVERWGRYPLNWVQDWTDPGEQ